MRRRLFKYSLLYGTVFWLALMIKYRRWVAYSGFFHPRGSPLAVLLLGIGLSIMLMVFLVDGIIRLFTE